MRKLGFAIPGVKGEAANDIALVTEGLGDGDIAYFTERLRAAAALMIPEEALVERMQSALAGRPLRDYTANRGITPKPGRPMGASAAVPGIGVKIRPLLRDEVNP